MTFKIICRVGRGVVLAALSFILFLVPSAKATLPYTEVISEERANHILNIVEEDKSLALEGSMIRRLREIARVGGRNASWLDLLQREIPESEREQLWRRSDRAGHEPTPTAPWIITPQTINAEYLEAFGQAPSEVQRILTSRRTLPLALPSGLVLSELMPALRKLHKSYAAASRYISQIRWRNHYDVGALDVRPYLVLVEQRDALVRLIYDWASQTPAVKRASIETVCNVAPYALRRPTQRCKDDLENSIAQDNAVALQSMFDRVLSLGETKYQSLFKLTRAHPGVHTELVSQELRLTFTFLDTRTDLLQWIQEQVDMGWSEFGITKILLENVTEAVLGTVLTSWEVGALPHVNGIGGNEIVMDSNIARWLELSKVVMAHEFGHVIGFPDCYVEFWDQTQQAFVYYTLDPQNRMCALSGGSLESHRRELGRVFR